MIHPDMIQPVNSKLIGQTRNATLSRRRMHLAAMVLLLVSSLPAISRADEPTIPDHDARLDGYQGSVVLDAGGVATSYILLFLLGGLGIGVVFISGKRTHLD